MPDGKFCCVGDYSVLIPYKDLELLLQTAKNLKDYQKEVERCNKQLDALHGMYSELLIKLSELRKML